MLIINKTKKEKEYRIPKMPNYENKLLAIAWLKQQKMEAELSNIKSISIQIKDINQMIYSKSFRMVSLHAKYRRHVRNTNQNDEDYITIIKSKKGSKKESVNKKLIYDIITSDWIINYAEIKNKTTKELEEELLNLETEIQKINIKSEKSAFSKSDIISKVHLLTYKQKCINEYLSKKQDEHKRKKMLRKKEEI